MLFSLSLRVRFSVAQDTRVGPVLHDVKDLVQLTSHSAHFCLHRMQSVLKFTHPDGYRRVTTIHVFPIKFLGQLIRLRTEGLVEVD